MENLSLTCPIYMLAPLVAHKISIHAPVKGATLINVTISILAVNFNPRTREGCDKTAPGTSLCSTYFNPRTREGCDLIGAKWPVLVEISIHAPVKGATLYFHGVVYVHQDFNPRTREGCDQ